MMPSPGDVVDGKYRVVRLIGDGGMGTVYEARHELLGVPVALKFLHVELAKRPGLAARFLQEARVSATIQSPHVTHVTDVDTTPDGSPYIVMELLTGESLEHYIRRHGKVGVDQAVDFGLQILSGLEAAHALGVVHRDLKPDNVFITATAGGPLLKLIDFGIAKLRETSEFKKEVTRAGVVMGTPEYMAPEQLYAAHEVDHRADLYSLGVILFELLSGARPADGDSAEAIIASVVSGKSKRLAALEPSLPTPLVALVERALSTDREQRFASAHAMRVELAAAAGELSVAGRAAAHAAAPLQKVASAPVVVPAEHDTSHDKVPDTLDGPPVVPRTLPPDNAPQRRPTGTQAATPGAPVAPGYVPTPYAPTQPAPHRARRSRTWPWVFGLGTVLLLGVGAAFAFQMLGSGRRKIPELDLEPIPTSSQPGAIAIDPVTAAPVETATPGPRGHTVTPGLPPRPGVPAATDGGVNPPSSTNPPGMPLPFPTLTLPSGLPPFPSSLPPGFPTALPSFLPQIPGVTVPAAPVAPAPTSSAN